MKIFCKNFLREKEIEIVPLSGYRRKLGHSIIYAK